MDELFGGPTDQGDSVGEITGKLGVQLDLSKIEKQLAAFETGVPDIMKRVTASVDRLLANLSRSVAMGEVPLRQFIELLQDLHNTTDTAVGVQTQKAVRVIGQNVAKELGVSSADGMRAIMDAALLEYRKIFGEFYNDLNKRVGLQSSGYARGGEEAVRAQFARVAAAFEEGRARLQKSATSSERAESASLDRSLAMQSAALDRREKLLNRERALNDTLKRLRSDIPEMRNYAQGLEAEPNLSGAAGQKYLTEYANLRNQINSLAMFDRQGKAISIPFFDVTNVEESKAAVYAALFRMTELETDAKTELKDIKREFGSLEKLDPFSTLNTHLAATVKGLQEVENQSRATQGLEDLAKRLQNLKKIAPALPEGVAAQTLNQLLSRSATTLAQTGARGVNAKGTQTSLALPQTANMEQIDEIVGRITAEGGLITQSNARLVKLQNELQGSMSSARTLAQRGEGLATGVVSGWEAVKKATTNTVSTMGKEVDVLDELVGSRRGRVQQLLQQYGGSVERMMASMRATKEYYPRLVAQEKEGAALIASLNSELASASPERTVQIWQQLYGDPDAGGKRAKQGLLKTHEVTRNWAMKLKGQIRDFDDAIWASMIFTPEQLGISDMATKAPAGAKAQMTRLYSEFARREMLREANLARPALGSQGAEADVFGEEEKAGEAWLAEMRREREATIQRYGSQSASAYAARQRQLQERAKAAPQDPLQLAANELGLDVSALRGMEGNLKREVSLLENNRSGLADQAAILQQMDKIVADEQKLAARIVQRSMALGERGVAAKVPADISEIISRFAVLEKGQAEPEQKVLPLLRSLFQRVALAPAGGTPAAVSAVYTGFAKAVQAQLANRYDPRVEGLSLREVSAVLKTEFDKGLRPASAAERGNASRDALQQLEAEMAKLRASKIKSNLSNPAWSGAETAQHRSEQEAQLNAEVDARIAQLSQQANDIIAQQKERDKHFITPRQQHLFDLLNSMTAESSLGMPGMGDIMVKLSDTRKHIGDVLARGTTQEADRLAAVLGEDPATKGQSALLRGIQAKVDGAHKKLDSVEKRAREFAANLAGARATGADAGEIARQQRLVQAQEKRVAKAMSDLAAAQAERDDMFQQFLPAAQAQNPEGLVLSRADMADLGRARNAEKALVAQLQQATRRTQTFGSGKGYADFVRRALGGDPLQAQAFKELSDLNRMHDQVSSEIASAMGQVRSIVPERPEFVAVPEEGRNRLRAAIAATRSVGRQGKNLIDASARGRKAYYDSVERELWEAWAQDSELVARVLLSSDSQTKRIVEGLKVSAQGTVSPQARRLLDAAKTAQQAKLDLVSARDVNAQVVDDIMRADEQTTVQWITKLQDRLSSLKATKGVSPAEIDRAQKLLRVAQTTNQAKLAIVQARSVDDATVDRVLQGDARQSEAFIRGLEQQALKSSSGESQKTLRIVQAAAQAKRAFGLGTAGKRQTEISRQLQREYTDLTRADVRDVLGQGTPVGPVEEAVNTGDIAQALTRAGYGDIVYRVVADTVEEQVRALAKGDYKKRLAQKIQRSIMRPISMASLDTPNALGLLEQPHYSMADVADNAVAATALLAQAYPPRQRVANKVDIAKQEAEYNALYANVRQLRALQDRVEREQDAVYAYLRSVGISDEQAVKVMQAMDHELAGISATPARLSSGQLIERLALPQTALKLKQWTSRIAARGGVPQVEGEAIPAIGTGETVSLDKAITGYTEAQAEFYGAVQESITRLGKLPPTATVKALMQRLRYLPSAEIGASDATWRTATAALRKQVDDLTGASGPQGVGNVRRLAIVGANSIAKSLGTTASAIRQALQQAGVRLEDFDRAVIDVSGGTAFSHQLQELLRSQNVQYETVRAAFSGRPRAGMKPQTRQIAGLEKSAALAERAQQMVALWDGADEFVANDIDAMLRAGKSVITLILKAGEDMRVATEKEVEQIRNISRQKRFDFPLKYARALVAQPGGAEAPVGPPVAFPEKLNEALATGDIEKARAAFANAGVVVGKAEGQGFKLGVESMADDNLQAIIATNEDLIGAMKSVWKVQSPSRVSQEVGEMVAKGFVVGFEKYNLAEELRAYMQGQIDVINQALKAGKLTVVGASAQKTDLRREVLQALGTAQEQMRIGQLPANAVAGEQITSTMDALRKALGGAPAANAIDDADQQQMRAIVEKAQRGVIEEVTGSTVGITQRALDDLRQYLATLDRRHATPALLDKMNKAATLMQRSLDDYSERTLKGLTGQGGFDPDVALRIASEAKAGAAQLVTNETLQATEAAIDWLDHQASKETDPRARAEITEAATRLRASINFFMQQSSKQVQQAAQGVKKATQAPASLRPPAPPVPPAPPAPGAPLAAPAGGGSGLLNQINAGDELEKRIASIVFTAIKQGGTKGFEDIDLPQNLVTDIRTLVAGIPRAAQLADLSIEESVSATVHTALRAIDTSIGMANAERTRATQPATKDLLDRQIAQLTTARARLEEVYKKELAAPEADIGKLGVAAEAQYDQIATAHGRTWTQLETKLQGVRAKIESQAPAVARLRETYATLQREVELVTTALQTPRPVEQMQKLRQRATELTSELKNVGKELKGEESTLKGLITQEGTLAGRYSRVVRGGATLTGVTPEGEERVAAIMQKEVDLKRAEATAQADVNKLLATANTSLAEQHRRALLIKSVLATVGGAAVGGILAGPGGALVGGSLGAAAGGYTALTHGVDSATAAYLRSRQAMALAEARLQGLRTEQAALEAELAKGGKLTDAQVTAWLRYQTQINKTQKEITRLGAQEKLYQRETQQLFGAHIPIIGKVAAALQGATKETENLDKSTQRFAGRFRGNGLMTGVVGGIIGSATLHATNILQGAFTGLGDALVGFNARIEQAKTGLRVFVADEAKAQSLVQDITSFAVATPFNVDDLLAASKRLLGMGVAAEQIIPVFRDLGAAVAAVGSGDRDVLNRVILAYGQIQAKNVLMSQDLRQLAEAGIPAFAILQEKLKLTAAQVYDIGAQHISSAQGVKALREGMAELYGPTMIAQMGTFNGQAANLRDVVNILVGRLGAPFTNELKLAIEELSDVLQEPGTLAAAEALGSIIGDLAKNLREFALGGREGMLTFVRELPTFLSTITTQLKEWQTSLSTIKLDIFNGGIVMGGGQDVAKRMAELVQGATKSAEAEAQKGASVAELNLKVKAKLEVYFQEQATLEQTGLTKSLKDLQDWNKLYPNLIPDEVETKLMRDLTPEAAAALGNFVQDVDKSLAKQDGPIAHLGATYRETFLKALSALGEAPTASDITKVTDDMTAAFERANNANLELDPDLKKLAGDYIQLAAAQHTSYTVDKDLKQLQNDNTRLSNEETSAIKAQKDAIDGLTLARNNEKTLNERRIQDIQTNIDSIGRETQAYDHQADSEIRAQQAVVDGMEKNNKAIDTLYTALDTRQSRIVRDLGDQKSITESSFKVRIDEATAAEKRQAQAIRDATRDQQEKVLAQQDEIDRIDDKYRAELRAKGVAVRDTSKAVREAERAFNKEDLAYAQQILNARNAGDTGAVKAITAAREQHRLDYDNATEVARLQQQVAQDALDATQEQAQTEKQDTQDRIDDINREAERSIQAKQREADKLADNRTAIEGERDTALAAYDEKIRIATAFQTIIQRSKEDVTALQQAQLLPETNTLAALQKAKADYDAVSQEHIYDLNLEKDQITLLEQQRQRAFEDMIAPMNAEYERLGALHDQQQAIRDASIARANQLKTDTDNNISNIQREITALQQLESAQASTRETTKAAQSEQDTAIAQLAQLNTTEAPTIRQQIQTMLAGSVLAPLAGILSVPASDLLHRVQAAQAALLKGDERGVDMLVAVSKDLAAYAQKQGLRLNENDIIQALGPTQGAITVGMDPDVMQFLAAVDVATGATGANAVGRQDALNMVIGYIKDSQSLRDKLQKQIAGEGSLEGNKYITEQINSAIEKLNTLFPGQYIGNQLVTAMGGLTPDQVKAAQSLYADSGTAGKQAAETMDGAAKKMNIAADKMLLAQGGGDLGKAVDRLQGFLGGAGNYDKGALGNALAQEMDNPFANLAAGQIRGNLSGTLAKLMATPQMRTAFMSELMGHPQEWGNIFQRIKPTDNPELAADLRTGMVELLASPQGRAQLETAIKAYPELWKALLGEMLLLDTTNIPTFDPSHGVGAALNQMLTAAEAAGRSMPQKLAEGADPAAVEKSAKDNLVTPTEAQTKTLTPTMKKTAQDLVGPDGLGFISSGASLQELQRASGRVSSTLTGALRTNMGVGSGYNSFRQVADNLIGPDGLAYMSDGEGGLVIVNGAAVEVGTALYNKLTETLGVGGDHPKFRSVAEALVGSEGLGYMAVGGIGDVTTSSMKTGQALIDGIIQKLTPPGAIVNPAGKVASDMWSSDAGPGGAVALADAQRAGSAAGQAYVGGMMDILRTTAPLVTAAVNAMMAESTKASAAAAGAAVAAAVAPVGPLSAAEAAAKFMSPVNQSLPGVRISQRFGSYSGNENQDHTGIDIAAPIGTPIHAAADGTVSKVGFDPKGYGNYCIIDHDGGWSTLYGHMMQKPAVTEGQRVSKGQTIGYVGTTGHSTGYHVHFETRYNGQFKNPSELLPQGQGGPAPAAVQTLEPLSGALPGTVPGAGTPANPGEAAAQLINGMVQSVKDAGGDFSVVLDAFFSGATELTKERIASYSEFAQSEMKAAFETLQLALQLIGGSEPVQLLAALKAAGVAGLPPTDPVSELLALLAKTSTSGFADALRRQLLLGSDMTVNQLANIAATVDLADRKVLEYIREQFGGEISISKLAESLVKNGALLPTRAIAPHMPDPAAEALAAAIKEFALANKYGAPGTAEAGGRTRGEGVPLEFNRQLTSFLKAIKDTQYKTVDDFLKSSAVQQFLSSKEADPAVLALIARMQAAVAAQPGITMSDLQGFLYGGAGFEPTDIVDATNDVADAVRTQTAILAQILLGLDATDPVAIEIWKDMQQTFKAQKADTSITAVATQQTAQNTSPEAKAPENQPTASAPAAPGAETPAAPATPLTQAQRLSQALSEARKRVADDEALIAKLGDQIEEAYMRHDLRKRDQLREELRAAQEQLNKDKKALADLAGVMDEGAFHKAEARLQFTIDRYTRLAKEAQEHGDTAAYNAYRRRVRDAQGDLDALRHRQEAAQAAAAEGTEAGAAGTQAAAATASGALADAQKKLTDDMAALEALGAQLEDAYSRHDTARYKQLQEQQKALRAQVEADKEAVAALQGTNEGMADNSRLRGRLQFTIDRYEAMAKAAQASGDTAAYNYARRRVKDAQAQLDRLNAQGKAAADAQAAKEAAAPPVDAETAARDASRGMIQSELDIRTKLVDMLTNEWRARSGQSTPVPVTPGGERNTPVAPPGGVAADSRRAGVGNVYVTVAEANNAHFVGEVVTNKLRWAARLAGG